MHAGKMLLFAVAFILKFYVMYPLHKVNLTKCTDPGRQKVPLVPLMTQSCYFVNGLMISFCNNKLRYLVSVSGITSCYVIIKFISEVAKATNDTIVMAENEGNLLAPFLR